jgi:Xaa-Pro aminopeptidase
MHTEQRQRAHEYLRAHGIERALFASPNTVTWLTGFAAPVHVGPSPFAGGPPLAWYEGGEFTLIVQDALSAEAARSACAVRAYTGYTTEAPIASHEKLQAIVRGLIGQAREIRAETRHLPAFLLPGDVDVQPIDEQLDPLRAVKTGEELEAVRQNFALTDLGHAAARRAVQAGQREIDVWQAVQSAIEQAAGQRVPLGNDCVVGYREFNIGGWPGDLALREGDTLIVDLSTRLNGYWSDSCGTYYASEPTPRQRAVHRFVMEALDFAISLVKPGALASEIDQRVRQFIAGAGYPVYPHHTGHGVGVSPHEEVRIVPYNQRAFEAGMVLMLEPGVYFPREFGVRLEDAVLVTADGAEVLTRHDKSLP